MFKSKQAHKHTYGPWAVREVAYKEPVTSYCPSPHGYGTSVLTGKTITVTNTYGIRVCQDVSCLDEKQRTWDGINPPTLLAAYPEGQIKVVK